MGLDYAHAKRALRVSLSRLTTEVEIEAVIERICDVARVRA
jgi:cysteine sulfinate desulfinase/cysteine desulfurase-like protein